jgi:LytS/YehU family sensor histidine kinase
VAGRQDGRAQALAASWSQASALRGAFASGLLAGAASAVAAILRERTGADAAAVSSRTQLLAFAGAGEDHHTPGRPLSRSILHRAVSTGRPAASRGSRPAGCRNGGCPLTQGVAVPLFVNGLCVGAAAAFWADGSAPPDGAAGEAVMVAELVAARLEAAWSAREAERLAGVELRALRAEISPHFVFNALNVVAARVTGDPEEARRLLVDFAEFLRQALRQHGECCPLHEEMWYVDRYLAFERLRFGGRLRVEVDVSPAAAEVLVPVLSVQPLVENAVLHGIGPRGYGTVTVRAAVEGPDLRVDVEDDGVGIPPDRLAHVLERGVGSGVGIGLHNVARRCSAMYGEGYGLRVAARPGGGTLASLRLPAGGAGSG